ncbi:hypothetical protein LGL55_16845 [Clostridium tagluense]|uniref:Cas10/Cmr2 second palm domain-containing protein n=1 Tax=Clostridium tagluense TaxID=360422 RepID=UPI001CF57064|nr:hypothetical protein [Clostridium tagluense]MCB2312915.1 hypothetical protein [Clostridium tagluense]MCB2317681.1 hypothetical protein [Clostridium tagluense]MCB2322485.1 hypothetical protein [Clostridium tagluense]MCB2327487.1 hypothetical protein [Clostridium tagluense]MCB2332206.1 hypothetical protein [Clostridium tagluense]
MSEYYIVKIDIGSKQKYIFSSNRLKEIIGASEIIRFVTEELGKAILKEIGKSTEIFEGGNDGNILFQAGGNAMFRFDNKDDAIVFNKIFSSFVMRYFDGLELLIVIKEFDIEKKYITDLYDEIEDLLTQKKGTRKNQFKRLSYGLTKICPNTRKPAGYIREGRIISKESSDKLDFYNAVYGKNRPKDETKEYNLKVDNKKDTQIEIENKDYMDILIEKKLIEKETINGFKFTDELDIIAGEKNEGSYIGITCIDGNGMGQKIESFNKSINKGKGIYNFNLEYIEKFNDLTEEIKDNYLSAFAHTVKVIISNYNNYCKKINFTKEGKIIPLRPIILAGDDITFISNGKISVEATRIFTEFINKQKLKFGKKEYNLTTSAGVVIVKRNYPFSRAVKLANSLEKNSKNRLRKIKKCFDDIKGMDDKIEYDASLIDWQVSRGDSSSELSKIRDKELTARPYIILNDNSKKATKVLNKLVEEEKLPQLKNIVSYNFEHFDKILNSISNSDIKSNLKNFFRSMNSNEVDAKLFALKYGLQDKIEGGYDINTLRPVIYDAIDIVDLYVCLKGENNNE